MDNSWEAQGMAKRNVRRGGISNGFWGVVLILIQGLFLAGGAHAVVSPAIAVHFCGLRFLDTGNPIPLLFVETINDPVFANANPAVPTTVESVTMGVWPTSPPINGTFECRASAFTHGPGAEADFFFTGFALPNARLDAFSAISVDVRFNSTQPGAPITVPFSILLIDTTEFFFSFGMGANINTSARFSMTHESGVIGFNHFESTVGGNPCSVPGSCAHLTLDSGTATVGQDYSYTISAFAALIQVTAAPPMAGNIETNVFIDPIIFIDPNLEFEPGKKYVDYVDVEISPNTMQSLPEPGLGLLLVTGIGALRLMPRVRRLAR
jgi:hypothetical protein